MLLEMLLEWSVMVMLISWWLEVLKHALCHFQWRAFASKKNRGLKALLYYCAVWTWPMLMVKVECWTVLWADFYPVFSPPSVRRRHPWRRESLKSSRCNKQNTVESLLTATSLQRPVFLFRRAVHTLTRVLINLFSTATATKACPQLPKISSQQRPVFSATDEKVKSGHDIWCLWRVDD